MEGDVFKELARLRELGLPAVLCIVTNTEGHAPRLAGAKMLVREDGRITGTVGGGALEHAVVSRAMTMMGTDEVTQVRSDLGTLGMTCGGAVSVYMESICPLPRVIVFGAGHIGSALVPLVKSVNFRVTVVDDRSEWANRDRLPDADEIVVEPYASYVASHDFKPHDYVVVVTRGHEHDESVLEALCGKELAYIGMIGSRRKVAVTLGNLRDKGVSEQALDRIHAPIGLSIGSETPAEIAISIVAQLIQVRSGEEQQ